jgi:hypothetical protein
MSTTRLPCPAMQDFLDWQHAFTEGRRATANAALQRLEVKARRHRPLFVASEESDRGELAELAEAAARPGQGG